MLSPDGMVMRKCCPMIDEGLLDSALDLKILPQFVSRLLPEAECKVQTGPTRIGMADVASSPGTDSALADFFAQSSHRAVIERRDIAPHGRGLAHVAGDIAVKQEITDMGKIVLGRLK